MPTEGTRMNETVIFEYKNKPIPRKVLYRGKEAYLVAYLPRVIRPIKLISSHGQYIETHDEDLITEMPYFTDWDLIGTMFQGIAIDEGGSCYAYTDKPHPNHGHSVWCVLTGSVLQITEYINTDGVDWKNSWLPNPNWRGLK